MLLAKFVFSFISYTSFQISALTVKTHGGDVACVSGLTTKCIKDLGCFTRLHPYYHPIHRPISCLPQDGIYPKYMLYTRRNTKHHVYLEGNQDSVRNSTFDPLVKTIVIVHGYLRKFSDMPFLITMKDMLLKHDDFNVIIVNWADFNGFPYTQAVPNARVVGARLAKLLQFLHEYTGIRLESVHLIGHSLGAHISGWTGERLKNLGRITGLDPAGPFFYHAPNCVKLDATDAKFVDIICTNVGTGIFDGFGLSEPTGHLNFYPNGGILQPGCVPEEDISKSVHRFDSCSHERVVYFFIESIDNGSCVFEGVPCDNWERYESGKCGDSLNKPKLTIKMGFHATEPKDDTNSERIFLKTRGSYPYCIED